MNEPKQIPDVVLKWMMEEGLTIQFTIIPQTKEIKVEGKTKTMISFPLKNDMPTQFKVVSSSRAGLDVAGAATDFFPFNRDYMDTKLTQTFDEEKKKLLDKYFEKG